MLKPYVCVACEKVILDQDGVASLIGLFSKILVAPIAGQEIPKNAVAPKQWAVFSAWDPDPGDENKEWFFCLQMFYPDQTQFGETTRVKINVELGKRSQVKADIAGFPVGQLGPHTVRCWIEEEGNTVVGPIEFKIDLETMPANTSAPVLPALSRPH